MISVGQELPNLVTQIQGNRWLPECVREIYQAIINYTENTDIINKLKNEGFF